MNTSLKLMMTIILCATLTYPLMAAQPLIPADELSLEEQTSVVIKKENTLADGAPSIKAKFGSGLTVTTANESFSFQIRGRFQSLIQLEHMYDSDESAKFSAQVRRARLKMAGHVGKGKESADDEIAGKHKMKYSVQLGFTHKDISGISEGKGVLLDAYLDYSPCRHLTFRFGQAKLPGNREGVTSSQKQQFVDRSYTSDFKLDRDFGLQLRGKFGENFVFKPYASIAVGEGRNITSMSSSGLDYTLRTEFLPLGDFRKGKGDYVGGDVDREPKPKLSLATGYDANHDARFSKGQRGGDPVAQKDRTTIHTIYADALFKFKGLSLVGEFAHRTVGMDYRSTYNTGNAVTASVGYNCKKNFEVAARFSRKMPLDNIELDKDMKSGTNAYTIAASKYFKGHNLKIQTDYTIFDGVNVDNDLSGLWRFQVEVAF